MKKTSRQSILFAHPCRKRSGVAFKTLLCFSVFVCARVLVSVQVP